MENFNKPYLRSLDTVFAYCALVKKLNTKKTKQKPFTIKKVINTYINYRSFIYGNIYFPRVKVDQFFVNRNLLNIEPTHIQTIRGVGLGSFHFNKIIIPKNYDFMSPRKYQFEFSMHNLQTPNFNFNLMQLLVPLLKDKASGFSYKNPMKKDCVAQLIYYLKVINIEHVFTIMKLSEKQELLPIKKYFSRNKNRLFCSIDFHCEILLRFFFSISHD